MITYSILNTPFGKIKIKMLDTQLEGIKFLPSNHTNKSSNTPSASVIIHALNAYFTNPKTPFNFPISPQGTSFQKKVWQALQKIPPGKTLTYGALAKKLKTSARAIGQACKANPLPFVIPCHRVVAANHIGGFCGSDNAWTKIKKWLLEHELATSDAHF